jgi:hypothetical protein
MKRSRARNEATHNKNMLYYGDNLDVMREYLRDEIVDLC